MTSLQICRRKNFENQLIFGVVIGTSLVSFFDSRCSSLEITGVISVSVMTRRITEFIHGWKQLSDGIVSYKVRGSRPSYGIIIVRVIRPASDFAIKINHCCQFKITDSSSIYSLRILRGTVQYDGALRSILVNDHQRQTYSNQNWRIRNTQKLTKCITASAQ